MVAVLIGSSKSTLRNWSGASPHAAARRSWRQCSEHYEERISTVEDTSEDTDRALARLERMFATEAWRAALLDQLLGGMPLAMEPRALTHLLTALGVDPGSYTIVRLGEGVRR